MAEEKANASSLISLDRSLTKLTSKVASTQSGGGKKVEDEEAIAEKEKMEKALVDLQKKLFAVEKSVGAQDSISRSEFTKLAKIVKQVRGYLARGF